MMFLIFQKFGMSYLCYESSPIFLVAEKLEMIHKKS